MKQPSLPGISGNKSSGDGATCYRCRMASNSRPWGMCRPCDTANQLAWRRRNHSRSKESKRRQKLRRRQRAIHKLGGKCACCGEPRWTMLHIDHIHNDGHLVPSSARNHYTQQQVIKDPEALSKYQILCANCNGSKYINGGACEHKTERRVDRFDRFVIRLDKFRKNLSQTG